MFKIKLIVSIFNKKLQTFEIGDRVAADDIIREFDKFGGWNVSKGKLYKIIQFSFDMKIIWNSAKEWCLQSA